MITWNGMIRFSNHGNFNPNFNPDYSYEVNKFGGIKRLVKTGIARNMWAIMKQFNLLPNDPRLKTLTSQDLDFIVYSMNQDADEINKQLKGNNTEYSEYEDTEFSKLYESKEPVDLLADGDNLDNIYSQVQDLTDDPDYDAKLDDKIERALSEKKLSDKNIDEEISEKQRQFAKDMKDKGIDIDDMY